MKIIFISLNLSWDNNQLFPIKHKRYIPLFFKEINIHPYDIYGIQWFNWSVCVHIIINKGVQ